jgi:hypothetical protein
VDVRTAIEIRDVTCHKTLSGDADEIRLAFNGKPVLLATIESGQTAPVNVIKVASDARAVISLWQKESGTRTITCIGRSDVLDRADGTAEFSFDDAHYELTYTRVEVSG